MTQDKIAFKRLSEVDAGVRNQNPTDEELAAYERSVGEIDPFLGRLMRNKESFVFLRMKPTKKLGETKMEGEDVQSQCVVYGLGSELEFLVGALLGELDSEVRMNVLDALIARAVEEYRLTNMEVKGSA